MAIAQNSPLNDLITSIGMAGSLVDPRQGPTVVEFFDFFFSDNLGRPANNFNAFIQWNVTGGSVDLVGGVGPGVFGAPPDEPLGRYVDLGGSTGNPGLFETRLSFPVIAGQTYNFSFDYRSTGGDLNRATASVGGRDFTVSTSDTDFRHFSQTFTASETAVVSIAFQGDEADRDGSGVGIDGVLFGQVLGQNSGNFPGGSGADVFAGSPKADRISGGNNNDFLAGAGGNDQISGDAGSDVLLGQTGNDVLNGGTGQDLMAGGTGNDTYFVDNTGDIVFEEEGQGTDIVKASITYSLGENVENLSLLGRSDLDGTGNALANTIRGNSGDNVVAGGLGNDTLSGGGGDDTFLFNTAPGPRNVDYIEGFSVRDDTIALDNAVFRGLANGSLPEGAFKDITDGAALDAGDRVLYDHDSGRLWIDRDGSGSAARVQFAILDNHPTLTFQNFEVV